MVAKRAHYCLYEMRQLCYSLARPKKDGPFHFKVLLNENQFVTLASLSDYVSLATPKILTLGRAKIEKNITS